MSNNEEVKEKRKKLKSYAEENQRKLQGYECKFYGLIFNVVLFDNRFYFPTKRKIRLKINF